MTTLRDDGYLETDSPVVAACFLGKWGVVGRDHVEKRCMGEIQTVEVGMVEIVGGHYCKYPILIPARVVAEVCYGEDGRVTNEWMVVTEYLNDGGIDPIGDWLREHAEEA